MISWPQTFMVMFLFDRFTTFINITDSNTFILIFTRQLLFDCHISCIEHRTRFSATCHINRTHVKVLAQVQDQEGPISRPHIDNLVKVARRHLVFTMLREKFDFNSAPLARSRHKRKLLNSI